MRCLSKLAIVASILLVSHQAFSDSNTLSEKGLLEIPFMTAADNRREFLALIDGRPITSITHIETGIRRDVIEIFSTLYALERGGLKYKATLFVSSSLERGIALIRSGANAMSAGWVDRADMEAFDNMEIFSPSFSPKIQLAYLFTSPKNTAALAATTRDDIANLSAISNRSWRANWQVLSSIRLKKLISVAQWPSMYRTVIAGRIDFLLAPRQPFGKSVIETDAGPLAQMERFAVQIPAERGVLISKRFAGGEIITEALARGMQTIGPNHFIVQALNRFAPPLNASTKYIILNGTPSRTASPQN